MKKTYLLILIAFIYVNIYAQPTPPAGYKWEVVPELTDEFNDNTVDEVKWNKYNPNWGGRAPGSFEEYCVTEGGGNLQFKSYYVPPQTNTVWLHTGFLSSKNSEAVIPGMYVETRLKCAKDGTVAGFWFSEPGKHQEIDVQEGKGYVPNRSLAAYETQMGMNTHYFYKKKENGVCSDLIDLKTPAHIEVGGNVGDAFHTYGMWWVDGTGCTMYHNGNVAKHHTFNLPPAAFLNCRNPNNEFWETPSFTGGMQLNLNTESQTWIGDPIPWRLEDNSLNTAYVDYVRTWKLVPDNGGGTNTVNCGQLPTSVTSQTTYTISIPFTASESRDIEVEFWNTAYLGAGKTTVNAGSGTASITIDLANAPAAGANYQWKASIRPVGANWQQNIDDCQVNNVTVNSSGSLPSPWVNGDIGSVATAGTASYNNGTFTIDGSGADIWNTADEFHYVRQSQLGDKSITARVESVSNVHVWSKAGVMFRDNTNANAKNVMVLVRSDKQVFMQWRTAAGGSAVYNGAALGGTSAIKYVRIERVGNAFTGSYSTDGSNFTAIQTVTIDMASSPSIGLAVTSHNDGVLCTADFTNVAIADVSIPGEEVTLGNASTNDAGHDGWKSNMLVNETDLYSNNSGSAKQVTMNEFSFYAWQKGDPVTPFIVKVNGDNNFTVLAVGTTRANSAYNIGQNTVAFNDGTPKSFTLNNGETIATGFLDANADGTGGSVGAVIPYDNGGDQLWYTGGAASTNSGSVAEGSAPSTGASTLTTLTRTYHYNISMTVGGNFKNAKIDLNSNDDQSQISNIVVYPNPAFDVINISTDSELESGASIKLYNYTGILVKRELLTNNNQSIEIGDLRSGIYVMQINNGNYSYTQRIIKR